MIKMFQKIKRVGIRFKQKIKESVLYANRELVNFAILALTKKAKIKDFITDALIFISNKF
jgi:hypothetical protein